MFCDNRIVTVILKLIIVLLVIGISVQFVLQDEIAGRRLRQLESVFPGPGEGYGEAVEVTEEQVNQRPGYIIIDLQNDLSLTEVWLVRNGERISSFHEGRAVINVGPGDRIHLDASAYKDRLEFIISDASFLPAGLNVNDVIRTEGNRVFLGTIEENQKL
ncbi:MAG: hypothetical protein ACOC5A_02065 [Halanaerobiales bacterium]